MRVTAFQVKRLKISEPNRFQIIPFIYVYNKIIAHKDRIAFLNSVKDTTKDFKSIA